MRAMVVLACAMFLGGCGLLQTQQKQTMQQRQDAALADPFNYSANPDPADISGGGIFEMKDDAFKRDMNSVLSP